MLANVQLSDTITVVVKKMKVFDDWKIEEYESSIYFGLIRVLSNLVVKPIGNVSP